MKIQPFIFNWKGKYENTCSIESDLTEIFDSVTIINSEDEFTKPEWKNLGDSAYFTEQFLTALNLFDGDVLFHIQGDVSYSNWKQLVEDAKTYYEKFNWGIYSPNVDYSWYDSKQADIKSIEFDESNLKMVSCTDCTVWFIHKDIINLFKESKVDFSQYKMGWGFDLILCAISHLNNRPVIRDYAHTVDHPQGTNYNSNLAMTEMADLKEKLPQDIKEVVDDIHGDIENISKYYL